MSAASPELPRAMQRSSRQRMPRLLARARSVSDAGLRAVVEMRMSTDAALEAVRRDVLLTTLTCLLAVFTGLLPVAIPRDLHVNPWMIVPHLASYAVLLATYLRRERLPSRMVAAVIIVTLYVMGTVGLLSVGIVGLNFLAYGVIVIAATMAFGARSGVLAAVICGATYVAVALLVSQGAVTFDVLAAEYLSSTANWTHSGILFTGFAVVAVVISSSMHRKIHELVRSEIARSQLLKTTNQQLAEANERLQTLNEALESRVDERTRRLEAANRELESFSYTVSHDLRSPLQVIEGFSSLALQDQDTVLTGKPREHIQRIQQGARRMHEMIDHLLKFSRLAGVQTQTQQVNLSEIAEAIVTGLRATQPQRQIRVDIEPGMTAVADPGLIHNVLQNLLANAWKFTSRTQDARIEFSARESTSESTCEADGGRIHCVRDNGAGFDPDNAERLFEPFVRLHDSREFAGNGVGLATTRRIIERHGGRIWAESRRGEGATFLFTLRP